MRKFTQVLLALIAVTIPSLSSGQVAGGAYSFGTFDNKGFDTINVGNLNVMFSIPIITKTGRAGTNFTYYLNYNGAIWSPQGVSGAQTWTPAANWGWSGQTQALTGYVSEINQSLVCSGTRQPYNKVSGARYIDSSGAIHGFTGTIIAGSCNGTDTDTLDGSYSIDGQYQYNGGKITARNGTVLSPPINAATGAGTYADSNGNQLSTNGNGNFTDTTGNVVLTITGTNPVVYTYKDTGGTGRSVSVAYTNHSLQTAFGCLNQYSNSSVPLVSSISYPDGSDYQFGYDATGRLTSVTLPTGGVITYTYGGISCSDGTTLKLTRTMGSSQWVYDRTLAAGETVVTDGLANQTKYSFIPSTADSTMLFESSRAVYQGSASGTPLLSRATCYNGGSCTATSLTVPITQISFTQSFNGLSLDGSTSHYNKYGLQTERDDYDFGTTTQEGNLLRKEVWSYPSTGIVDLLQSDVVSDGSGNTLSETTYGYDQTTPTASSGVPAHVAVTGQRGNLTSVTQYASSSTSYTTKYTYEDTGSVLTTISPATSSGATTTYSYDPTFVYSTAVQLPTPSSGVTLSYGQSYDQSYTGLPKIQTDPNSQPTTVNSYDSMLRPTEIDYPDGGKISMSYPPNEIGNTQAMNSGTNAIKWILFDGYNRQSRVAIYNGQSSNPWYQQDTCFDANGRVNFKAYRYQANGFDSPEVCNGAGDTYSYDTLGRVLSITHGDGTSIQNTYMGRSTKVTDENGVSRITQIDGLGRTVSVCEISSNGSMPGSGSPSSSCNPDIAGTGFLTTYAYAPDKTTVTQGVQTRVFQTDWLGRPTLTQEPESGTTTYSYIYNSTGLVATRTRPQANQTNPSVLTTTTTQYDALGRPLTIKYNDGITPDKNFNYDANCCWSQTATNMKGHLVVMGAQLGTSQAAWSGTLFSYGGMGRVIQQWQCGPSTCGTSNQAAHTLSYGFDWTGDLISETSDINGTINYGRSPAGEVTSISTPNPQSEYPANLVSNITNGPNGPTSYLLGNGLNAILQYDSMGRMYGRWICQGSTQASCMGGTQDYGFIVNRRGDQASSSCDTIINICYNYGYDEFDRLTSMTFTSGGTGQGPYNFTYSYDRWGNRWAQNALNGGPSPQFTFNTANNQVSGYTYDAAGNLMNDGAHGYTYDAEGNMIAVDNGNTAKYVYDALSRRVEAQIGGRTTDYVYDYAGRRTENIDEPGEDTDEGRIYWDNMLLAYRGKDANTYFEHEDWTGTTRLRTDYLGHVAASFKSLPSGDGNSSTINETDAGQEYTHFAMLDLDNETDTDHAQFRQYGNIQGRWMSPDPYSGSYDPSNPQSMNRYSYVLNNPLAFVDPDGTTQEDPECEVYNCSTFYPNGAPGSGDPGAPTPGTAYTDGQGGVFVLMGYDGIGYGVFDYEPNITVFSETDLSQAIQLAPAYWYSSFAPAYGQTPIISGVSGSVGTAPNNGPTWKQKNQNCLNKINSTPDGKLYNFFSPLSMIPGIGPEWKSSIAEDVGGGAAKYGIYSFFKSASTSMVRTPFGTMSGAVADTIHGVAEGIGAPLMAAATVGQVTVHAGCAISATF